MLRKCVFVVLVSLILALLCGSVCAAAPKVNLDGSYVSVYGGYVVDGLPYDWSAVPGPFYEWGLRGQMQVNIWPTPNLRFYAALLCDLGSYCSNGQNILEWYPTIQDYRLRLSLGIAWDKITLELYLDQFCTHHIDAMSLYRYEYTAMGFDLSLYL